MNNIEYLPESMNDWAVEHAGKAYGSLYNNVLHRCSRKNLSDIKQICMFTYIEGLKTYASQISKPLDQMDTKELDRAYACAYSRARWAVLDSVRHYANDSAFEFSTRQIRKLNMIREFLEENPGRSDFEDSELADLKERGEFPSLKELRAAITDYLLRNNEDYIVHLNELATTSEHECGCEEIGETVSAPITDKQYDDDRANSCYEALKFAFDKCLKKKEVMILCHYYGLFGWEKMKTREITKLVGYRVTDRTIRRIQNKIHNFFEANEIICMADIL